MTVNIVGHGAEVRKQVADRDSAAPVAPELPGTGEDVAVQVEHGPIGLERHGIARLIVQTGLGVEGVDVGEASRQVAEDDVPNPRLMMTPLGGQRILARGGNQTRVGRIGHEGREGQHPESRGRPAQHLAPGEAGLECRRVGRQGRHGPQVYSGTVRRSRDGLTWNNRLGRGTWVHSGSRNSSPAATGHR